MSYFYDCETEIDNAIASIQGGNYQEAIKELEESKSWLNKAESEYEYICEDMEEKCIDEDSLSTFRLVDKMKFELLESHWDKIEIKHIDEMISKL